MENKEFWKQNVPLSNHQSLTSLHHPRPHKKITFNDQESKFFCQFSPPRRKLINPKKVIDPNKLFSVLKHRDFHYDRLIAQKCKEETNKIVLLKNRRQLMKNKINECSDEKLTKKNLPKFKYKYSMHLKTSEYRKMKGIRLSTSNFESVMENINKNEYVKGPRCRTQSQQHLIKNSDLQLFIVEGSHPKWEQFECFKRKRK